MIFLKQIFRSPVRLTAFFLLLSLTGSVLCIGWNAYAQVRHQAESLREQYTTIAVPDYRMQMLMEKNPEEEDVIAYIRGILDRRELIRQAVEAAGDSKFIRLVDQRELFSAYIPGSKAITSGSVDWKTYKRIFDNPYNLAVFVITCGDIERIDTNGSSVLATPEGEETLTEYSFVNYYFTARVEECVSLHNAYTPPKELSVYGNITDERGRIPFEEGERYLVWGVYTGQTIIQVGTHWEVDDMIPAQLHLGHDVIYRSFDEFYEQNGKLYLDRKMKEGYPICAKLEDEEDAAAYLASSMGTDWQENIMEICNITSQSVPIMTTNKVESLLLFNSYDASIIEGRSFTTDEYKNGSKVCIIGADYAGENGLEPGDTISLSFYNSGYISQSSEADPSITQYFIEPYSNSAKIRDPDEYLVIGVYQSPGFIFNSYAFSPNTIFVPAASVTPPDTPAGYMSRDLDILTSLVLHNGTIDQFEAEMADNGYGGCFLYFDQGFSETGGAGTEVMEQNAGRLLVFSVILFLAAGILFAFLYVKWSARSAMIMRLNGARPGKVLIAIMECSLVITGVSLIIGGIISYSLFSWICGLVFTRYASLSYSILQSFLILGISFLFIMAVCICFILRFMTRNPLQFMKKEVAE